MAQRIGFIGAGLMGHGMAKNIVEKGYPLTVLAQCVFADDGILAGAHAGLIVIDCTTAEPSSTERVAKALAAKNVRFADAPLTRSPKDAEAGRLNTLVGADDATLAAIRPVLETFCENVFHVGPLGSGHTLKLINNFLSQGVAALVAEAVTTATKAGIDLKTLFEVVSAGGANSSVSLLHPSRRGGRQHRIPRRGRAPDLHARRRSGRRGELRAGARACARQGQRRADRAAGLTAAGPQGRYGRPRPSRQPRDDRGRADR
jgi:3-hydroxyisobutyrate dehydrogenase-like beta-hydroxyacid dehydrogenase